MTYKEFLKKQAQIYNDRFRNNPDLASMGIKPNIPEKSGGYLVAFRHPTDITQGLEELNAKVLELLPCVSYDRTNAHSTVSDYQVSPDFNVDNPILTDLSTIVSGNINRIGDVRIIYDEFLVNTNTGIAAGRPNQAFYEVVKEIVDCANSQGIELRMPWGSHITAFRPLEKRTPEQTNELVELLKKQDPLGESRPISVDVGHFNFSPTGFIYTVHESFSVR